MSSKPKAPKSVSKKAAKAKPTLKQMLLKLELTQEALAKSLLAEQRRHDSLSKGLLNVETNVAALQRFAVRVETKVFPAPPTPEELAQAERDSAEFKRRLEGEQIQRQWKEAMENWKRQMEESLKRGHPTQPAQAVVGGTDWGASGGESFKSGAPKDFFGYKVQSPVWSCPCHPHEKDCTPRGTLKRKVFCYSQKTNRTPSEVWHKLYDTLVPIVGYDPRMETTLTERALHVLVRMGHIPYAMSIMDAWLDRLVQGA